MSYKSSYYDTASLLALRKWSH